MSKRIVICFMMLAVAAMFVVPMSAWAEKNGRLDDFQTYYSTTDPGNAKPPASPWVAINPNQSPGSIGAGSSMWFADTNVYVPGNEKVYTLKLFGTGSSPFTALKDTNATGYLPGGFAYAALTTGRDVSGTPAVFTAHFRPQPAWEKIQIKNTGGSSVAIDSVSGTSDCHPVPSLTTYGLIALLLLLIGSAVWVMRHRRRAHSVA